MNYKETNKRLQLENLLANINNELDKIRNSIKECLRNTQLNKDDIAALKEALKRLEETKADKNWVQTEFERVIREIKISIFLTDF